MKEATPHHESSQGPLASLGSASPLPFQIKMWTKGKCVCWPLAPPGSGKKLACLSILVRRDGFRKRRKLAPEDGLAPINYCKDSNMGEEINGVHFRLRVPPTFLHPEHTIHSHKSPGLNGATVNQRLHPIRRHFAASVYRQFPAVFLAVYNSKWMDTFLTAFLSLYLIICTAPK